METKVFILLPLYITPLLLLEKNPILCACGCERQVKNGNKFIIGHNNHRIIKIHESYKKWLDSGTPILHCQCGCNQEIIIKNHHKFYGIPNVINKHITIETKEKMSKSRLKIPHKSYQKWLDNKCPKILCKCGCNQEIIIKNHHRSRGIPEYIVHHANPYDFISMQSIEIIRNAVSIANKNRIWSYESRMKQSKNMMYKNNPNWKGGISFDPYTKEFNNILKIKIRKRDRYICQICGSLFHDYKNLHIHHIDYNKKNNNNNNLISLCNSCHAKTNFNRKKWTKFFTKIIKLKDNNNFSIQVTFK